MSRRSKVPQWIPWIIVKWANFVKQKCAKLNYHKICVNELFLSLSLVFVVKSKQTNYKAQKPILEKKRRDRINSSLDELKNILLAIKQRDVSVFCWLEIVLGYKICFNYVIWVDGNWYHRELCKVAHGLREMETQLQPTLKLLKSKWYTSKHQSSRENKKKFW